MAIPALKSERQPMASKRFPIKVIRIITRLNVGGPAQHAVFLTSGLGGRCFEIRLVTGMTDEHEGDMSFIADAYKIPLILVESLRNETGPIGDLKAFWRLYQIIKKEKPDLVHLHLLKARFLGGIAAILARTPVIVETFHGNVFDGYYGKLKTTAILLAERLLGWFVVDRVIALSEMQKEELTRYRICPPQKIDVIPLGLDLDRFLSCSKFRGQLRVELGIPEKTVLVGAVGRLVAIKGLSYLLEAVYRIGQDSKSDFCLLVVGGGPLRLELESQASTLGIEDKVRFLGWRFDLEKVYADLDIVVLSSLNEGTPVSLIEALAAGRAVVATKVGGVPDVVEEGKTGLLVPAKDSLALADAILRLLSDAGLRKRLGEEAKASVFPKYDVSRLVRDMRELYLSIVAGVSCAEEKPLGQPKAR